MQWGGKVRVQAIGMFCAVGWEGQGASYRDVLCSGVGRSGCKLYVQWVVKRGAPSETRITLDH